MATPDGPLPSLHDLFDLRRVERVREGRPPEEPPPEPRVRRARLVRDRSAIELVRTGAPPAPDPDRKVEDARTELRGRFARTRAELSLPEPIAAPEPPVVVSPAASLDPVWRITVSAGAAPLVFFLAAVDLAAAARLGAVRVAAWMREHRPGVPFHLESVGLELGVLA